MKAIIQRVLKASVTGLNIIYTLSQLRWSAGIDGDSSCPFLARVLLAYSAYVRFARRLTLSTVGDQTVGSIGHGLCVFIGISRHDTEKELDYIVRKILNLRIFSESENKRWMKSVVDMDYEILCISQFTLEVTLKGNKPDFSKAMGPELARPFYNKFLETLKSQYKHDKIQNGEFGAYMQVNIQNDGPVTIPLETKPNKEEEKHKSDTQKNLGATKEESSEKS